VHGPEICAASLELVRVNARPLECVEPEQRESQGLPRSIVQVRADAAQGLLVERRGSARRLADALVQSEVLVQSIL
jgi:hypothetical protein